LKSNVLIATQTPAALRKLVAGREFASERLGNASAMTIILVLAVNIGDPVLK